jgi:hypothetical protein
LARWIFGLDSIDVFTHVDLRDRALLGVLAYTFARIGTVVRLKVEDYLSIPKTLFAQI